MGNKIWIGILSFCAFVYAAVCIAGLWFAIKEHVGILRILNAGLGAALIWWVMLRAVISRVKHGPKGPPPDPLEDFHVDFD